MTRGRMYVLKEVGLLYMRPRVSVVRLSESWYLVGDYIQEVIRFRSIVHVNSRSGSNRLSRSRNSNRLSPLPLQTATMY